MSNEDLRDYLVSEAGWEVEEAENLTSRELVQAWLNWNGILGYTDDILEVVEAAYNFTLYE